MMRTFGNPSGLCPSCQMSSYFSRSILSLRVSTLRARTRRPFLRKLLSIVTSITPRHLTNARNSDFPDFHCRELRIRDRMLIINTESAPPKSELPKSTVMVGVTSRESNHVADSEAVFPARSVQFSLYSQRYHTGGRCDPLSCCPTGENHDRLPNRVIAAPFPVIPVHLHRQPTNT